MLKWPPKKRKAKRAPEKFDFVCHVCCVSWWQLDLLKVKNNVCVRYNRIFAYCVPTLCVLRTVLTPPEYCVPIEGVSPSIISAKPGSENIALYSFVYIAYKTFLMLLTKESALSLVLSLVKLMHCLNTILCIFHWHTEQKDILSIKIFINLLFTTWQAIPFKRKFYFKC